MRKLAKRADGYLQTKWSGQVSGSIPPLTDSSHVLPHVSPNSDFLLFSSFRPVEYLSPILFAVGPVSGFGSEREGYMRGIVLVYNGLASLVMYSKCL